MLQTAIPHSGTLGRYQGNACPPIKLSKSDKRPVPDGSTENSTVYRNMARSKPNRFKFGRTSGVVRKFRIVQAVPGCPLVCNSVPAKPVARVAFGYIDVCLDPDFTAYGIKLWLR